MDAGGGGNGAVMDAGGGGGNTGPSWTQWRRRRRRGPRVAARAARRGVDRDERALGGGAPAWPSPPATTRRDGARLAAPAATHDEVGSTARGIGQTMPGNDEATLMARGVDPAIATAIGTGEATTARDLATPAAIHEEAGAAAASARRSPQTTRRRDGARHRPGDRHRDRHGRRHDGARPRDPGDAGSGLVVRGAVGRRGTAAVVGGLAGAGLLILGGAFAVRRQRVTPV